MTTTKREGREVWAARVRRWREGGLTAAEFAAETGINENTLTHWAWRLGKEGGPPRTPAFVEVVTPGALEEVPAAQAACVETATPQPFHLVLPGGVEVRVPPRFDAAALRALVAALCGVRA